MAYQAHPNRYESIPYKRCGNSGIQLPAISLGLWHNFGHVDDFENGRDILKTAFDNGITHFDLANNYGPPYGSAEENFGKILNQDFSAYRDELIISTKAGYDMWPGPYGDGGSRKYLMASLNQSLKRMNLDYVDVFYHHRPDAETPLEESMQALTDIVKSGKALYAAISNYPDALAKKAIQILKDNNTPCLLHQAKYSMFFRWVEEDLLTTLEDNGVGCIAFSPLAEGLLTNKYIKGIPSGSRASKSHGHLEKDWITESRIMKIKQLNAMAESRNQSLAQLALIWLLRHKAVSSVLIGASSSTQLTENIKALDNSQLSNDELLRIEAILDNKTEFARNL